MGNHLGPTLDTALGCMVEERQNINGRGEQTSKYQELLNRLVDDRLKLKTKINQPLRTRRLPKGEENVGGLEVGL